MINQAMIKLKTSVFKKYSEWRGKPQSRKRYLQSYPEYLKNHYQNNKQTNKNPWIVYEKMGQRLEKTHTHTHTPKCTNILNLIIKKIRNYSEMPLLIHQNS